MLAYYRVEHRVQESRRPRNLPLNIVMVRSLERIVANTPALKEVARRGWKEQISEWLH
jgi:hypothetical protein